jgi:hypothetical protein
MTPYSPVTIDQENLEKHLLRVKQKNTQLTKGQIVQKRSVDNSKRSNAMIE